METYDFDKPIEKQPSEQLTIKLDLADLLASLVKNGYVLSTATLVVFDAQGVDVTATLVSGTPTVDIANNCVYATFIAGVDGNNYFGRLKTVWTLASQPDQKPESDFLIEVRQKGF